MQFTRDRWPQKGKCFVLMPFGEHVLRDGQKFDWNNFYDVVIKETIKQAGMEPLRADGIPGAKPLLERLWEGIQEAEIIVADLTGQSPNVMFELGLAHVIGKRILILTMDPEDFPVDLGHFVQIRYSVDWQGSFQLQQQLHRNLLAAQNQPLAENMLVPLPGGGIEIVPTRVLSVTAEFAIVETRDGRRGFLSAGDYSWTRKVRDLTKVLRVDKEINGAFLVDAKGQQKYSLTFEDNPWPKLEKEYPVGHVFRGTVVNLAERIGAFVNMSYGIHGLIPQAHLPREVMNGMDVKARVARIDSANREVSLQFVEVIPQEQAGRPLWGPFHRGQAFEGLVQTVAQDKGFILVRCDHNGNDVTGLLHFSKMSPLLKDRFFNGDLRPGEPVSVEVIQVDGLKQRLSFCDRPSMNPGGGLREQPVEQAH